MPLDFRTTLIQEKNKIVIQAKPLQFKTDEEILKESVNLTKGDVNKMSMQDFLDSIKQESFDHEDEDVIHIDPDINIKEKFEKIDMFCNLVHTMNNTINAPTLPSKKPLSGKRFSEDGSSDEESARRGKLDAFEDIVQAHGIDIDELELEKSSTSGHEERKIEPVRKPEPVKKPEVHFEEVPKPKAQGGSIITQILKENKEYVEKRNE